MQRLVKWVRKYGRDGRSLVITDLTDRDEQTDEAVSGVCRAILLTKRGNGEGNTDRHVGDLGSQAADGLHGTSSAGFPLLGSRISLFSDG